jgi:hypothetical protein
VKVKRWREKAVDWEEWAYETLRGPKAEENLSNIRPKFFTFLTYKMVSRIRVQYSSYLLNSCLCAVDTW